MMPLTNDWTALNAKVDAMQPNGNTNVTIGLQLAFQALSPVAPFNASAPKSDLDKVIILLTDGDNTRKPLVDQPRARIDARTKLACTNVKAANIKLYTIRVIDGNASLLQECATKPTCTTTCSRRASSRRCSPRLRRTSPICDWQNRRRSTAARRKTQSPASRGRAFYVPTKTNRGLFRRASASTDSLRTACRFPWRDRHRVRRSWSPARRSPHRRSSDSPAGSRSPSRLTWRRTAFRRAAVPSSNAFLE